MVTVDTYPLFCECGWEGHEDELIGIENGFRCPECEVIIFYDKPAGLEEFIKNNHTAITVMGVFGAIAIYLTQISAPTSIFINLGIVSSLFLFVITAILVNKNAFHQLTIGVGGELIDLLETIIYPKSLAIIIFILPFNLLTIAVISISINFSQTAPIIVSLILFPVSVVFIFNSVYEISEAYDFDNVVFDILYLVSPVILIILGYYVTVFLLNNGYSLNIIHYFEEGSWDALLLTIYYSYMFWTIVAAVFLVWVLVDVFILEPLNA